MGVAIVPIVEGQSEQESVPVLLRRLLAAQGAYHVTVARPFRVKRTQVVRSGELERAVEGAARSREGAACLLVILDADDDCPARLGPQLLERCRSATRLPAAVVLATMELEAWFLGAKESLRGVRGIRDDASAPSHPEQVRGAKEQLTRNMQERRYLAVDDQPALAGAMDLEMASQRCPSFRKLAQAVGALVGQVAKRGK